MPITCIYLISTTIDSRIYIGSAKDFHKRKAIHMYLLRQRRHHSPHLQYFYNKYGLSALEFSVIRRCDALDLIPFEQNYIDAYKPEFNSCKIAGSTTGVKNTAEQKKKIAAKLTGALNPFYGKTHTEETRNKMKAAWVGRTPGRKSDETKNKIRLSKIGGRNPMAKMVLQFKDGLLINTFSSGADCARALGVCPSSIKNVANRNNRKCRGFVFKYAS